VRGDPRIPLRVAGMASGRREIAHRRIGGQQALCVAGLARARTAEDEDPTRDDRLGYGLSPRSTRGFGIRSRRGWLARVKAYQPVGNPAMSSFGNRSRAFAVIVRPR